MSKHHFGKPFGLPAAGPSFRRLVDDEWKKAVEAIRVSEFGDPPTEPVIEVDPDEYSVWVECPVCGVEGEPCGWDEDDRPMIHAPAFEKEQD